MNVSPPSKPPSGRTQVDAARLADLATLRRRPVVAAALVAMAALLVWVVVSVGVLILHDRQDRAKAAVEQRAREEQAARAAASGAQVLSDVYGKLNSIDGQLAALRGVVAPPPISPPTATTTTRPAATAVRPSPATSSTTATTSAPRPTTTTTATTAPPTTTTTSCLTGPVVGCLGRQ